MEMRAAFEHGQKTRAASPEVSFKRCVFAQQLAQQQQRRKGIFIFLQLFQRCGRHLALAIMVAETDSEWEHGEELARRTPPLQPVQRCVWCASTSNLEMLLPTGRWVNLPMEERIFCNICIEAAAESDSDDEPPVLDLRRVQRCAGCGSSSTDHLEVLLPTGRWANATMEQRMFCDSCIETAAAP